MSSALDAVSPIKLPGELPESQRARLQEKLAPYWVGLVCEFCRQSVWGISPTVFQLQAFRGGAAVFGPTSVVPLVCVTCNVCGNTKLLNAITLGLIDPQTGGWARG
jgi:hypothetical protein